MRLIGYCRPDELDQFREMLSTNNVTVQGIITDSYVPPGKGYVVDHDLVGPPEGWPTEPMVQP